MAKYAQDVSAADLSLVDIAEPLTDSPAAVELPPPVTDAASVATDRFFAEAARELDGGQVDQPLWVHAINQAGGDEKRARPAYLRARATALRVEKRNRRAVMAARRARTVAATGASPGASARAELAKYGVTGLTRRQLAWLAGVLSLVLVAATVIALRSWSQSQQQPTAAPSMARPPAESKPSSPIEGSQAAVEPQGITALTIPREDFPARIRSLKEAGNWHVVVLYAGEWTRHQPGNADAWKELSTGYTKLGQFGDALDAATKAVTIAPSDASLWRTLGQVNLALVDLPAALAAFEKAADLEGSDVASLVQVATLNMRLGNLQASKVALTKALAASPGDVDALCAASSLAQREGRAKEAESIRLQVSASGAKCRDPNVGDGASVSAPQPAKLRTPSAPAR